MNLNVPIQSLHELPQGAAFVKKDGRAEVYIRSDGNNLIVEATCDSLMQQCEIYYNELVRIRSDTKEDITEKQKTLNHTGIYSIFFVIGFVLGVAIILIIKYR